MKDDNGDNSYVAPTLCHGEGGNIALPKLQFIRENYPKLLGRRMERIIRMIRRQQRQQFRGTNIVPRRGYETTKILHYQNCKQLYKINQNYFALPKLQIIRVYYPKFNFALPKLQFIREN
jgi:hypothetical protein